MKAFLSILFVCMASFVFAIQDPGPPPPLYIRIYHAPVIVCGTLIDCNNDPVHGVTEANITVHYLLKGVLEEQKIAVHFNIPHSKYPLKRIGQNGETKIFFLSKNKDGNWFTGAGLSVNGDIIKAANGPTIPDFKAGIALFEQKYTYFQEKKANNITITLENPTNNKTFAFLSREMMQNLIYTPKTVRKTVKKGSGKRKKGKK